MDRILQDFHVHTNFSDGKDDMEDVAAYAFSLGMTHLGFSDHGYAAYDTACCIPKDRVPLYIQKVQSLKEKYAGRMHIYCGIEQDYYAEPLKEDYDYVIGSVHNLDLDGQFLSVDWKPENLYKAAQLLGGDMMRVCELYFELEGDVAEKTHCDIIGHFDLVSKLNTRYGLFDENDPRYIRAWKRAADRLLEAHLPFEINTGAIARGYKQDPYPAAPILTYLNEHGARFVLNSDCHKKENLMFGFGEQSARLAEAGITPEAFIPDKAI